MEPLYSKTLNLTLFGEFRSNSINYTSLIFNPGILGRAKGDFQGLLANDKNVCALLSQPLIDFRSGPVSQGLPSCSMM